MDKETVTQVKKTSFRMRPIARHPQTGEILDLTPKQIGEAVERERHSPEGQEREKQADARRRQRFVEQTNKTLQRLQSIEIELTTLDVSSIPGQFNALYAALCELNPEFVQSPGTNLGNLYEAVIKSRSDWFGKGPITEEDFWNVLKTRGVPRQQYFTGLDQRNFEENQDKRGKNYTLQDLLDWKQQFGQIQSQSNLQVTSYYIHTSQEMDALNRAQCNGLTFQGYTKNDQAGAIIFEEKGLPHQIRLMLTEEERAAGLALAYLEDLVRSQDADAMIATSYILSILAPPPHLPRHPYAGGWINFDDVIKKIGWYPQTTQARHEMRQRIWEFVRFGERAHVIGHRAGTKYTDGEGNEIDTTIHGAAWRVMKTQTPDSPSTDTPFGPPLRAEIVVSEELTRLISNPKTAQYLGYAEILGAIPGGKPAGAWARVIGVALMSFWRRKPREVMSGQMQPTRRELLSHFPAKVTPYNEVLKSSNPARAIEYWCDALQILVEDGFIERTGEAKIDAKTMRKNLPRQNWQDSWLDQLVEIEPSIAKLKPEVAERARALPEAKPRDLRKKPRTKKTPKSQ